MTAPARFSQADIKRAASGVMAAGLNIARIEVDLTGKIVIIPGEPKPGTESNEWADLEKC